ncbi:MAG: hypothetical protein KDD44_10630, partial [Bdellovibrionales bacterium]|nr:hypothetical protein [Bdellovibrionales bacterium]
PREPSVTSPSSLERGLQTDPAVEWQGGTGDGYFALVCTVGRHCVSLGNRGACCMRVRRLGW